MTTYIPALTIPDRIFANTAASILTPVVLGSAVGILVSNKKTKETYKQLHQPALSPPAWVFGPVWTILYGLMGYASHRAWTIGTSPLNSPWGIATARHASTVYSIQLALNLVWTPLFFGARKPVAATADILALIGTNVYLTYLWSSVDKISAYALVPYIGWLGFATYLCTAISHINGWDLNPKVPKTE
ncbi:hypothetical protein SLS53_004593 [Cytospora paraplurivora]|uniref:Translocator protein n=1 Tax=Cytospora paraplurivora TaxID=2898453 RepID=A0AAN9U7B0_9PEZI